MEINKRLFEDVLSNKLKGTFVLRNRRRISSSELTSNISYYSKTHPYRLCGVTYAFDGLSLINNLKSNNDIIDFISDTNMKENELTITIPDNKVVDWDESKKQNKIILKNKQLTYGEICRKLFGNQDHYLIERDGNIEVAALYRCAWEPNAAKDRHQLECILAKNQLANVAKYLNGKWKPGKTTAGHFDAYVLYVTPNKDYIGNVKISNCSQNSNVLFKSSKLAQQAIEILGEETIKLALEPLGI